ncbi:alkanesulfonate monooxygenase SsuD/methylene tetrahydromethanopterin reductase-like flavin-dependent oxidoreductase (luciferase family) [Actinocorallia herbida]|uniref:Alkanesulfonate monooxygenase SsuD/methylene tetrahydromethanopterin reductase-like flavin-dependent oxidoreductase (Luciferase family) n=1 Tax=Actinocorallia herbida TaxID=58109 RepID=A0A3N1CQY0_9ACTN|nr:LLM class flavin-dependent oxidoreductase [Actinocorallia herbida]ROO83544.1 alkanesulfonate monooxygenase SsuD/methylene tetrahydromethanopterin reductase-like flavin-dependent oxidoreductase (luciferase family) [Actinocorallia herbida]
MTLRISVGYELEVRGRSREVESRAFRNVLDQVVLADELGMDTAWFVEHHFTRGFSHSSAPDLVLAAASQRTSNIHLGLGVVLLPFQSPIRTAERVATLDVLSGGRVEFGTGRGASPLEYQAFQRPFEQSRQLWEESLEAVLAIWNADGQPITRSSEYFEIPNVAVYPRPTQTPHPPVWVASTSLEGFLAAGKQGYNLLGMTMLKGIDDVAEDIAAYKACLAENGFDPESRRIAIMIPWYVGETRAEAVETASDPVLWYLRRQVNLVAPPSYTDARHATHRVLGQQAVAMPPEEAMDILRDNLMVVIDDVEGSRKAIERLEAAGATDLILQAQVGGLAHDHVTDSMRRFMNEVMK